MVEIENEIKGNIDEALVRANTFIDNYNKLIEGNVNKTSDNLETIIYNFKDEIEIKISRVELDLNKYVSIVTTSAVFHINRGYGYYSPSLLAFLGGIVKAVDAVVRVVRIIVNTRVFQIAWNLHKIAFNLFPQYRQKIYNALAPLRKLAAAAGYTADSFFHLFNAMGASAGLIGGLTGKESFETKQKFFEGWADGMEKVSVRARLIAEKPDLGITDLISLMIEDDRKAGAEISKNISDGIANVTGTVAVVTKQVSTISNELVQFNQSLPDEIRKYIPQEIFTGLANLNVEIETKVFPALVRLKQSNNEIANILGVQGKNQKEIQGQLRRPGLLLGNVDNLTGETYDNELTMIDEVTNRKYAEAVDKEYETTETTIGEFEKIDAALKAPTPEPGFLTIEAPGKKQVGEIIQEPYETWFIKEDV